MDFKGKTVFWFRRDLRLEDNRGLYEALFNEKDVIPIFIFDRNIIDELPKNDPRVTFIHKAISQLKDQLNAIGTDLKVFDGTPKDVFKKMEPAAVYANHDYEPYARSRDQRIAEILSDKDIRFRTYKDQVIFERNEVAKDDGSPYTVYTPFSKKWKSLLAQTGLSTYRCEPLFHSFAKVPAEPIISMEELGFEQSQLAPDPIPQIDEAIIDSYNNIRDYPGKNGTSRLGIHLRFGTLSIRYLVKMASELNQTYLNELIWREFYMMILWHFPHVVDRSFKPAYDAIEWRNNEEEFEKWCQGKTGIAMVDAGMRELNATGYMHNRARMIVASFLSKNLLIDWRWGEAYFAEKLLDFELASNNGGWQWAAGCGCDAAPYFRVFNPDLQASKFDPDLEYVKKWVPEYNQIHYRPMVDLKATRVRAIDVYKSALNQTQV